MSYYGISQAGHSRSTLRATDGVGAGVSVAKGEGATGMRDRGVPGKAAGVEPHVVVAADAATAGAVSVAQLPMLRRSQRSRGLNQSFILGTEEFSVST